MRVETRHFDGDRDADYAVALEIRKRVFVGEQKVPESIEIDEHEATSTHFVLRIDGRPAATGRLRTKDGLAKFERVATLPEFRGRGVGRVLMSAMQSHAASRWPNLIPTMHAQTDAIGFYERLGWQPRGEIFYEAEIPHRLMQLPRSS